MSPCRISITEYHGYKKPGDSDTFWCLSKITIHFFFLLLFLQTSLSFCLGEKQAMCRWAVYKLNLSLLSEKSLKHTPLSYMGCFAPGILSVPIQVPLALGLSSGEHTLSCEINWDKQGMFRELLAMSWPRPQFEEAMGKLRSPWPHSM